MSLCIGLTLSPTWLNGDGWRVNDSKMDQLFTSEYYVDLAQRAENAALDFVFKPDHLFLHPERINISPGHSSLDPIVLMSALAKETKHIGLVATVSTTFSDPYTVARQLQSLNWLSEGRIGWNVVTSIEGSRNYGLDTMPDSEERYERAIEYLEVVQKLWNSFPRNALAFDAAAGQFANKDIIVPIYHKGRFYEVDGPLNVPAYSDDPIPLFQAGASHSGRSFAANIADAIFAATPSIEVAAELRADLQRRAKHAGRDVSDIRMLPGLHLFVANTCEEAKELFDRSHAHLTVEHRLAALTRILGVDVTYLPIDEPVTIEKLPNATAPIRSKTHEQLVRRLIKEEAPTLRALLKRPEVIGSGHWVAIGTPKEVVEQIEQWFYQGAMDGFIALPGGSVHSLHLFLDKVIPLLKEKGLFSSEYGQRTFKELLNKKKAKRI